MIKNQVLCGRSKIKKSHRLIAILVMVIFMSAEATGAFIFQASYYSVESLKREGTWKVSGGRMANGKMFDETALTCAAGKQYKLGTYLRVRNLKNGKAVVVKVSDRLARRFYNTRIDLTKAAFQVISGKQGLKQGLLAVSVEVVE